MAKKNLISLIWRVIMELSRRESRVRILPLPKTWRRSGVCLSAEIKTTPAWGGGIEMKSIEHLIPTECRGDIGTLEVAFSEGGRTAAQWGELFLRDGGHLYWRRHLPNMVEAGFNCSGYWRVWSDLPRVSGSLFGRRVVKRSRVIYLMEHGFAPVGGLGPKWVIDHVSGETLDDDPSNLELVTFGENLRRAWARKGAARSVVLPS